MVEAKNWSYHNPVRVFAGCGYLANIADLVPAKGKILLVTTAGFTRRGVTGQIARHIGRERLVIFDQITPNPELDFLDQATEAIREQEVDGIVALGGGSALDAAKILGVTIPSGLSKPLDLTLRRKSGYDWQANLPVVAIPTTSGSGAEVTPFATVWDQDAHKKYSVTGDLIYPALAILDSELTLTLPYRETLYSGLDAVSHALESLWNKNKTPISEAFAVQSLNLLHKILPNVLKNLADPNQRAGMQTAALLSGLAISQTRTAIAHSISYPLTSRYGVPHGLACSFTLPALLASRPSVLQHKDLDSILSKTADMLKQFNLPEEMRIFADEKMIFALMHEMVSPERAGNYIGSMGPQEIEAILSQSYGKTVDPSVEGEIC